MYRDNERHKSFARRTAILAGGKLVLFSVLAGRLYQLQVLDSKRYKTLAEDNRINMRLLAPLRGRILDRWGEPLAINRENYRVVLVAEQARNVQGTLDRLSRLIWLTDQDRERVLREVRRRRGFVPITVREDLDWREVARIEVHAPNLPGVSIDVGPIRQYPYGEAAAHILGYVAAVSEVELTGDPLLELPGFHIGKNGIEKRFDLQMRGKAGSSQVEVNAVGRVIKELSRQDGQPGGDVTLTIDMALQKFSVERLAKERSGSAVLMDITTGDILALASVPSFDPNQFAWGLSSRAWGELVNDPLVPLSNKAISGLYAPGSTFKLVVTLAAIQAGAATPDQTEFCVGHTQLGRSRFHCWKKGGHGLVDMIEAIQKSCDVYFYSLARKVGIDRIAEMAVRLGLGNKVGLVLPGEQEGLVPTRGWKLAMTGVKWQPGGDDDLRHRSGLRLVDAVAARGDDRADRGRRARGQAAHRASG